MRQKRHRAKLKPTPNGGPPGGNRQSRLFSRSELHRRKPAKAALKPKPKSGDLFPDDGQAIFATMAVGTNDDGVRVIGRYAPCIGRRGVLGESSEVAGINATRNVLAWYRVIELNERRGIQEVLGKNCEAFPSR